MFDLVLLYCGIALLLVALLAGWVATIFSLPGTWLIVVATGLYAWLGPAEGRLAMSGLTVATLVVLALVGEAIELVASALGVKRLGGSRRGAVLAMVGSLLGATVGAGLGLPIPVVGSIAGVLLGAAGGALVGAMIGEWWKGRDFDASFRIGQGAFLGRLIGSVAKIAIASAMVAIALAGLVMR